MQTIAFRCRGWAGRSSASMAVRKPQGGEQVIDGHFEGARRYRRKELFQQSLSYCYNPKLLKFSHGLTRGEYRAARHALVSQKQEIEGCLDDALKRLNLRLDVAMAAPEFLTVLTAATESPFIATLPTWIAKRYASMFGLTVCDVPFNLEVALIAMVWAAHADKNPPLSESGNRFVP